MKQSLGFMGYKQVCFNEQKQAGTGGTLLASAFQVGLMTLCLCTLFLCYIILSPQSAFAAEHFECEPTEEQMAEYEADGSLEERTRYMESLDNSRFDPRLIQEALQRSNRDNSENGSLNALSSVPSSWKSGMPTVGTAYIVLVCVDFQDIQFTTTNHVQLMEKIAFGEDSGENFPLDSLTSYYQRSSYEKLTITSPLAVGSRVLSYTAAHERSYYSSSSLLEEVMSGLESSENFSLFDGNDDGIIDAVYLYFAGGNTGWGTTWWPQESIYTGAVTVDDMELGNFVLLDTVGLGEEGPASENQRAAGIMIHETGHVLGLPDYYAADTAPPSPTGRSGILTFDMMNNNNGDHNGFSKWVLGWLDGDEPGDNQKVMRVIVNEQGITVKQGDVTVEYPGVAARDFTLDSFTSLVSPDNTGGILVVSNDKDVDLFSQYFLFQYDSFAQNQSLYLDPATELPSAFRMFHVNAVLNDDQTDFKYSNFTGQVYNQLIELVDPDMGVLHEDKATVPHALGGDFHCMLFAGDTITPTTFPSSNFAELPSVGFTGLSFKITASGGVGETSNEQGELTIGFSPENPLNPDSFALTPLAGFDSANNAGSFLLGSSFTPVASGDPQSQAYLLVDGEQVPVVTRVENLGSTNSRVTIDYSLISAIMTPDSVCELVFPAGFFIVGQSDAGPVVSKELRYKVSPGNISSIEYRKSLTEATGSDVGMNEFSNLIALNDKEVGFFQWRRDGLYFYRVNTDDGSLIPLTGTSGDGFRVDQHSEQTERLRTHYLEAVRLSDGSLGLLRRNADEKNNDGRFYVYRIALDGELLAKKELTDEFTTYRIAACGTNFFVSGMLPSGPTKGFSAVLFNTGNAQTGTQACLSNPLAIDYYHLVSLGNGQIAAYEIVSSQGTQYCRIDVFDENSVASAANEAIEASSFMVDFLASTAPERSVEIQNCPVLYGLALQGDNLLALMEDYSSISSGQSDAHFALARIDSSNNITTIGLPAANRQARELNGNISASAVGLDAIINSPTVSPSGPHGSPYSGEKPANSDVIPENPADMSAAEDPALSLVPFQAPLPQGLISFRETTFRDADLSILSSFNFVGGVSGVWNMDSYYAISVIETKEVYVWKIGDVRRPNYNVNPANPGNNEGLAATGDSRALTAGVLMSGLAILSTGLLLLSRKLRQATQ